MALNFTPSDRGEIMKMIENFLKEEIISNDYYCSKCKSTKIVMKLLGNAREKSIFIDCPKYLFFSLRDFHMAGGEKLS